MRTDSVQTLATDTFDAATENGVVVVDFWSSQCMSSKVQLATFELAAETLRTQAHFAKIDIAEYPDIAERFGIRETPTVLLLQDGIETDTHVGMLRADDLASMIRRNR